MRSESLPTTSTSTWQGVPVEESLSMKKELSLTSPTLSSAFLPSTSSVSGGSSISTSESASSFCTTRPICKFLILFSLKINLNIKNKSVEKYYL